MKYWIAIYINLMLCISLCATSPTTTTSPASTKPNIIFIIGDDLGWNDVSHHGSDQISTPNIDSLGYNGLMFRRHYTQQACTPSRAAFLTGQYPIRLGFQGFPLDIGLRATIPKDVNTLPISLKKLGYSNHLVGKWHLGYGKRNDTPMGYGYDTHYGYWNGYIGYFDHHIGSGPYNGTDFHDNLKPITDTIGQYATDLFTKRATDIIKNHPKQDSLFLVVSHLAAHTGRTISNRDTELEVANVTETNRKYCYIKDKNRRKLAEIIEKLDNSVGDVVEALAQRNMLENSIIVFFSDNGAPTYGLHANVGSNYPLRGLKMTMYDGAIRTPSVIYSPLLQKPGGIYNGLFHVTDWVPTMYKAAGGNVKDLGTIDGLDQWENLVKNRVEHVRKELFIDVDPMFNYSGYIGYYGKYKLINHSTFMYNFTGDRGFKNSQKHYEKVKSCKTSRYVEQITDHRLTLPNIKTLRSKITPQCAPEVNKELRDNIKPCEGVCLFNLDDDPCEFRNVADVFPAIVDDLSRKLNKLIGEAKPKPDYQFDEGSDPRLCNNTWFNWLDGDDGCWYKNNNNLNYIISNK